MSTIKVPMLKDIRRYEPKFMGPLTLRQTISVVIAVVVFFFFFLLSFFLFDLSLYASTIIAICPATIPPCFGWAKKDGLPLEQYLTRIVYLYFLTPRKRTIQFNGAMKSVINEKKKRKKIGKVTYDKTIKRLT